MLESYRDLIVWQRAMETALAVYSSTAGFPKEELFGLTSQMSRARVSVASNIAEGYGRNSPGEYKQFLGVARGSNHELQTQIILARQLGFGITGSLNKSESLSNVVSKMLNSLISKL